MKEFFIYGSTLLTANKGDDIQNSLENKISYYHIALFLIMLPFDRFYSQLILASLIIHTLIHLNKQKLLLALNRQNLVLSSVFLLTVVGTAWSDDKGEALKESQEQLAIVLFPFVLSATGLDLRIYKKKLLTIFGLTCVMTILFLYADAIHIILYNKLPLKTLLSPVFINHHFSEPIGIHATYLSMYAALSIAAFLNFFIMKKNKRSRFLYAAAIIILLAGLLQLASKSVLIAAVIFIPFGISFFITNRGLRVRLFIAALVISLITLFAITRIDSFNKRYIAGLKHDLTQARFYNEIADPRIMRWYCALTLVKQAPLIGYGSGSEKRLLKEKYFENKLYNSYLHELDAHNQYLSLLIKTGVVGLIIFLATLFIGFVAAWRSRDFVFAGFMILISIVSFSENILDVNKGIFFYSFFLSFFFLTNKSLFNFSHIPGYNIK